jgi:hypothetical protein
MAATAQIDTTSLLTILGVLAAVWALISPTGRLRLRFCATAWDWCIGGLVFFLIHYLVFAPVLQSFGLYYSLGEWKWGLDSGSAVYLLLLMTAFYFFWRTRFPTLARGRVKVFLELVENLHLTNRYDELVLLVEPQLPTLISLARRQSLLVRLIDRLDRPHNDLAFLASRLLGEEPQARSKWRKRLSSLLQSVKSWSLARAEACTQAQEILLTLVTSPKLTSHLAAAHPHFCLKLLETGEAARSDFIEHYVDALLNVPGSRLYIELKNNQNLNVGSRLGLPAHNRLLRFFFADAAAALKHGIEGAIGEAICRRLDEDKMLVHEGIHQGLQDHMWLHYFGHFTEKILKQMPGTVDEDTYQEWPTPFHYLLYRLIDIATDWAEQCSWVNDSEIPEKTRITIGFDRHYISKQATKALGLMLEDVIESDKLSTSFKTYLLEVAVRTHIRLQRDANLADVASAFTKFVISGSGIPTEVSYRVELRKVFRRIDHVMRHDASTFEQALDASIP